jgi:hypothetical protein
MAQAANRDTAKVDYLVDENGSEIDVPDDSTLRVTTDAEQTVGATGPAVWWQIGLIGLAALALVLLLMQIFGGGPPATDTLPGSPVAAPINQPVAGQ